MEKIMKRTTPAVNYVYFGVFFLSLLLFSGSTIFSRENQTGSYLFFTLYALGQSMLEVLILCITAFALEKYCGKRTLYGFIGMTFVLYSFHALDFMMNRVLDLSILETIKIFVLDESWGNFVYLLEASGIPNWAWLIFFIGMLLWPMIGIALYKLSSLACQKPLFLKAKYAIQALVYIPCAIAVWDYSASKIIHPDGYTSLIKSIPWKVTFFHPENVYFSFNGQLKAPWSEEKIQLALDETGPIADRPNIYMFVIESLRADFITQDVAPNLHGFKKEAVHFDTAISGGNGTHLSWHSIFHSQFPYFWSHIQKENRKMGSPALAHLKKLGYKIHVYSSAQLGYYGMEKQILGKDAHLADSYQKFHHIPPANSADSDAIATAQLQKDLRENPEMKEGNLFIVFWDGTHFDYSWPKNWAPKFTPFAPPLTYFKLFHSDHNIALMKNRYRNAVNHMDSLFGSFYEDLPNKADAIVMIMGDHGEEFFECGNLFHNSHLANEQITVPLYMKFGENHQRRIYSRPVISQMDVMPSLIDYLTDSIPPFLEGHSVFQKSTIPFAVTARFNASNTPYEFCIHNGTNKLILQFQDRNNALSSKQLRIVSLRTKNDQSFLNCKRIKPWIRQEFGPALRTMFETPETPENVPTQQ